MLGTVSPFSLYKVHITSTVSIQKYKALALELSQQVPRLNDCSITAASNQETLLIKPDFHHRAIMQRTV